MANPLDIIAQNFNASPLWQAVSSLPGKKKPEELTAEFATRSGIPAAQPKQEQTAPNIMMEAPVPAPTERVPAQIPTGEAMPMKGTYNIPQQQTQAIVPQMSFGGIGQQMRGVGEMQKAEAEGLRGQADLLDEQSKLINERGQIIEEQQKKQAEAEAMYQEQRKALDAEVEGKSAIDKDRLFKNMTTGNKILTGIGLALSAIGGSKSMGATLNLINSAIDQDIAQQEKAYGIAKEKRSAADSLYKENLGRLGDQTQAMLLTKAQNLEAVKAKIDSVLARAGSQKAIAQGEVLKGQLQSQIDQTKNALGAEMMKKMVTAQSYAPGSLPANYAPRTQEEAERFIPGVGLAQTKEDRKKVVEGLENASSFNRLINEAIKIREEEGGALFGKNKDRLDAIQQDLTLKLKSMSQLGVMSDSDKKLLEQIIPDISRYDVPGRAPVTDLLQKLQTESKSALAKQLQLRVNKPLPSMGSVIQRGGL